MHFFAHRNRTPQHKQEIVLYTWAYTTWLEECRGLRGCSGYERAPSTLPRPSALMQQLPLGNGQRAPSQPAGTSHYVTLESSAVEIRPFQIQAVPSTSLFQGRQITWITASKEFWLWIFLKTTLTHANLWSAETPVCMPVRHLLAK